MILASKLHVRRLVITLVVMIVTALAAPGTSAAAPTVTLSATQYYASTNVILMAQTTDPSWGAMNYFSGPHLVLYRVSGTPEKILSCTFSQFCYAGAPTNPSGATSFRAYLINGADPVGLPSNPVAASPIVTVGTETAYAVTLTPTSSTVSTGASTTMTAGLDRTLSAGHVLDIVDLDAPNAVVASCSSGATCARVVSKASGTASRLQAIVRRSDDIARPALSPISVSQVATVSAVPYSTTINAAPTSVATGQSTTLTATANQPLVPATNAYSSDLARLVILDTAGTQVAACTASPCQVQVTPSGIGPFTYRALVRASTMINGSTSTSDFGSSSVQVTRPSVPAPTISLTTATPTMLTDRPNLATAITTAPVSSADQTRIVIIDVLRNATIATCSSGTTCAVDARLRSARGLTLEARVLRGGGAGQVIASSGSLVLPLAAFTMSIEPITPDEVYTTQLFQARVTLNQAPELLDVDHTGASISYRVSDGSPDRAFECSVVDSSNPRVCIIDTLPKQTTPTTLTMRVLLNEFNGTSTATTTLTSASTRFTVQPFEIDFDVYEWFLDNSVDIATNHSPYYAGGRLVLTQVHDGVRTERDVCHHGGVSTSGPDGPFIYTSGSTFCVQTAGSYDPSDTFSLNVIGSDGAVIASTGPKHPHPSSGPGGPNDSGETDGGGNPSEDCSSQRCGGDPISFSTGEFSLARTDSLVAGRGAGLEFTRTYSAFRGSYRGELGFGWTTSYSMRVDPVGANANLSDASRLSVLQENGSRVYFERAGGGQFTAAPRVRAKLRSVGAGFVFERHDGTTWAFDSNGRATTISDRNGYETHIERDADGALEKIIDPSDRELRFETDVRGRITKMWDPADREWVYAYDAKGDLRSVTPPTGGSANYEYDSLHRMTKLTDYAGGETQNTYDGFGRVTVQRDPEDAELLLDYSDPNATVVTQPSGSVTRYEFTNLMLAREVRYQGTPMQQILTYEYDEDTLGVTSMKLGGVELRTSEYDGRGNAVSEIDGEHRETTREFNGLDLPTRESTPDGVTTRWFYDSAGNLERTEVDPSDSDPVATTRYEYESGYPGDVTAVVDAEQRRTEQEWSPAGYLTRVEDGEGVASRTEYDSLGRVTAQVDDHDERIVTQYLDDGRRQRVIDELGRITDTSFDELARPVRIAHPGGRVDTTQFDAVGRVRFERRNGDVRREHRYDAAGRLDRVLDAAERETVYQYDAADRVRAITNPDIGTRSYAYDARGRRNVETDPLARTITTTYNDADEPMAMNYSDPATTDVVIHRNAAGRIDEVTDATGTTHREYDGFGRLEHEANGAAQAVTYDYDKTDNLVTLGYPGAGSVTYRYDDAARMENVQDWFGRDTALDYDDLGQLDRISLPNGIVTSIATNDAYQPTSIGSTGPAAALPAYTTGYDAVSGLLTSRDSTNQPGAGAESYSYDAANRLDSVTRSGATRPVDFNQLDDLILDDVGASTTRGMRREATTHTPTVGAPTSFTHSPMGERASATTGGVASTYDYDQLGQLTRVARGETQLARYRYDWTGLRTHVTTAGGINGHAWSRAGGLPVLVSDGATRYLYGPGGIPLAQTGSTAASTKYLLSDSHGSVRAVADPDGAIVGTANYTAFGAATQTGEVSRLGYAGQLTDPETGLQYLRARYYDPATGGFLTRDPIEEQTGDAYGYAGANPVMNSDPTGLDFLESASNFFAGTGDTLTFGRTAWVRRKLGVDDVVDKCSGWYTGGQIAGAGLGAATGGSGVALVRLRFAYQADALAVARASRNGRQAVLDRNALKVQYRTKTPWVINRWAERRNVAKYGDEVGPDYYQLFNKYGTDREVQAAAGRTAGFFG